MVSAYVSAFEFVFNEALLVQWAMFLWYTLTPRWSKKTTILCFLPICLLAPTIAALFPSRSVARMFSVPTLMIASAFVCYRSKPIRTFFCAFYPQLASVVCETLNLFIFRLFTRTIMMRRSSGRIPRQCCWLCSICRFTA